MKVQIRLDTFVADRQSYRPYNPLFNTDGKWYVEVEVDNKEVRKEKDNFIFTEKGLTEAIDKVATIFDEAQREYLYKIRAKGE